MTRQTHKVLFLQMGSGDQNARDPMVACIAERLPEHRAEPLYMTLEPGNCEAVLDALEDEVLPIVLKPPRRT